MPGKVGSKYKIDRRRTRRKTKPVVLDDDDSGTSASEWNDTDEETVGKATRKRRSSSLNYKLKKGESSSPDDTSNDDDDDDDDDHSEVENVARSTLKSRRAARRNTTTTAKSAARRGRNRSGDQTSTHRNQQRGFTKNGGDILATLSSPSMRSRRSSAANAKEKLTMMAKNEMKYDGSEDSSDDNDDDHEDNDDDDNYDDETERLQNRSAHGDEDDSDYEDETMKKVDDNSPKKRNNKKPARNSKKPRRKKVVHSSEDEFILDSDANDDSSLDFSVNDDGDDDDANVEDDIRMIGDPDLSDEDDENEKGRNGSSIVNIDNENFGTIDDDDDDSHDDQRRTTRIPTTDTNEILPSPRGIEDAYESNNDLQTRSKKAKSLSRRARCPECPSTEDAITAEPLSRLHVCYIAPDGKTRQCFNLETLRKIALNSSRLQLRVDIDGERQNFLQPPAFRTAMSDDLLDQIASKFGRGALDLHGPYYTTRKMEYDNGGDHQCGYDSYNSSSDENNSGSFEDFRDRLKDYFKRMGSQDIYVCPICYSQIHRSIQNPNESDSDSDASKEFDSLPCDSIYDPMTVLGHLDKDTMSIASQFCFKKLADVKKHLREEHNVDTRGIQGNELYKRFRVRAPDGLLQRWLSTQVKGHGRQGDMRMYWFQGNDQIFIQLLDLIERVKEYSKELPQIEYNSSEDDGTNSEDDGINSQLKDNAKKARKFYTSFSEKAFRLWIHLSSPFLKSDENINDFIERDGDYIDESDQDERPHAVLHRQLMNSMNEDSDENDMVHILQRKYAETNNNDTDSKSSSTDDELEIVDGQRTSDAEDDEHDIGNRNGYYSPIEEEKDEWMLNLQSQRKRKASNQKKVVSSETKAKTPVGKRLFLRKSTPKGTTKSTPHSSSRKKIILSIDDSSGDEKF